MSDEYAPTKKLSRMEATAWSLYCEETAGDMDVRDFWEELPKHVQQIYLDRASDVLAEMIRHGDA